MSGKTKKTRRSLKAATPPKYAVLKKIALSLPGAEEVWFHGHPWFNIGSKSFALFWQGRWIFKLPKPQQMMLFDARPDTFTPMRAGRMIWRSWPAIRAGSQARAMTGWPSGRMVIPAS